MKNKDQKGWEGIVRHYSGIRPQTLEEARSNAEFLIELIRQVEQGAFLRGQVETHESVDGYCCACDYDIAVMEEKIKKVKEAYSRGQELLEPNSITSTVLSSPEWKLWYKEVTNRLIKLADQPKGTKADGVWDINETQELGLMSIGHWADFVSFIRNLK